MQPGDSLDYGAVRNEVYPVARVDRRCDRCAFGV